MKFGNLTLGQIEAGINKIGGEEAFMRLLRDELVISEAVAKQLFERLSATIAVPAMTQFIAKDNFVVDTSEKAKMKISGLSIFFENSFLQKIESDEIAAEDLAVRKLLEYAYDFTIIATLGGETKVGITLGQFFAAFAKQPNGEKGALLTNGNDNVGYIRDINGIPRAACGLWNSYGWYFKAHSPHRWDIGSQILSR